MASTIPPGKPSATGDSSRGLEPGEAEVHTRRSVAPTAKKGFPVALAIGMPSKGRVPQ